jgi:hypothetical protein
MNAPEILPESRPYDPANYKFYTTAKPGETLEDFMARDWAIRATKERKPNIGHCGKHAEGASAAGRESARVKGLTKITDERKAVILAVLSGGEATVADIARKVPSANEEAVRHVVGLLEADGSIVRRQSKRVILFSLAPARAEVSA